MKILINIFLLIILLPAASALGANQVVSDSTTGLTVSAPAGYQVVYGNGVYRLFNSKNFARFMLARSPLSLNDTASSFIKLSKISGSRKTSTKNKVTITGKLKSLPVTVIIKPVSGMFDIVTYGPGTGATNRRASTPRAITAQQIAALDKILRTRRGGATAPLQVQIPLKRSVCSDGFSTSVSIPNTGGWNVTCGGQGIVSGANLKQGAFGFGIPSIVSYPGFGGLFQSNPVNSANAIFTVWPQYISWASGGAVQIQVLQVVPVFSGWLGPNFPDSSLNRVQFLLNGRPWQGLISSGIFDQAFTGFAWYHSYIAVPQDGPGGFGPALINTWASWDNSQASAARLNQAIQTLLSIKMPGGPIDPDVFQNAANAWDAYIRE